MLLRIVIRENITPRGDGNTRAVETDGTRVYIRENITPRGDGNYIFVMFLLLFDNYLHKREYNSERRRKLVQ